MTKKLVIVESPAKARTIANYLGSNYQVEASVGHIRDLPQPSELPEQLKKGSYGKFAVDIEHDFEPYYVVDADKKKKITELKRELKNADELYLATDEDREGEAIAWHLNEVLAPKIPVKRMVFHEITKEAIARALQNTRQLDINLVNAQETRRILDRLVGYEVSPLLWRKINRGLSAGRVQSVATRLVVERERERMAFTPAEYWDLLATLSTSPNIKEEAEESPNPQSFTARAISIDGVKLATGKDFTDDAQLTEAALKNNTLILKGTDALRLGKALEDTNTHWQVAKIETKPYKRRPAPPFTTSTLQQESSRKLRLNSRDTMRLAQSLYENGYITYMRTDSVSLSDQATQAARSQAKELYGNDTVPEKPRNYTTKSKGAQEAHEAIRPAGDQFRTPDQLRSSLKGQEFELYNLIWKRTIASQMNDAQGTTNTLHVEATLGGPLPQVKQNNADLDAQDSSLAQAKIVEFTVSGTVITHPGFLSAYEEGSDPTRNSTKEDATSSTRLPQLTQGQELYAKQVDYSDQRQHFTAPPPRYTDASLVKALEERGIGRPSTYAATISVITDRGYVMRRGQALVPAWLAFSVVRLLEENLKELVDYDFTAVLENDLDRIAAGKEDRTQWLKHFYWGQDNASEGFKKDGLAKAVAELGDIDAKALNSMQIGPDITLRVGRYGPYLERGTERASVPQDLPPAELTLQKAQELLATGQEERVLGVDPASGNTITVKVGRYGPYVESLPPQEDTEAEQANSKTAGKTGGKGTKTGGKLKGTSASLFKSMTVEGITLDQALKLLSLPRVVGKDENDVEITTQNGRYGPYLKRGSDSRTLENEEQIFTLTLEQALQILAQPKTRGRAASSAIIKEFGTDPVSEKPVTLKNGRYGPYVTDGLVNATVPRSENPEEITEERAFELLAIRRDKAPVKRKTATKKTATKKTATKAKATTASAKKTATKKTATKKTATTKKATTKATKETGE